MADTVFINGKTYHVQHWDGARMYTKAHGPGTLVDSEGYTYYCTLDHGIISWYCLGVYPGGTWAGVYNALESSVCGGGSIKRHRAQRLPQRFSRSATDECTPGCSTASYWTDISHTLHSVSQHGPQQEE